MIMISFLKKGKRLFVDSGHLDSCCGLDIGSYNIKLFCIKKGRKKDSWKAFCRKVRTPKGSIGPDGSVLDMVRLMDGIRELTQGEEFQNVAVTLRGENVKWFPFLVPQQTDSELAGSLRHEVAAQMNMDFKNKLFEYENLGLMEDTGRMNVLCGIAPEPGVFDFVTMLQGLGLDVISVEVHPLPLLRILNSLGKRNVIGFDLGAESTTLIAKKGETQVAMFVDGFKSEHLNRSLIMEMGPRKDPEKEAEMIKHGRGLIMDGTPETKGIFYSADTKDPGFVLQQALYSMTDELKTAMAGLGDLTQGEAFDVVLMGGGSLLARLDAFLKSELALNVRILMIEELLSDLKIEVEKECQRSLSPEFAVSIGLALLAMEGRRNRRFNLLPEMFRPKQESVVKKGLVIGGSLLLAGSILAAGAGGYYMYDLNQKLQALQKANEEIPTLDKTKTVLEARVQGMKEVLERKRIAESQVKWDDLMFHVADNVPKELWISEFGTSNGVIKKVESEQKTMAAKPQSVPQKKDEVVEKQTIDNKVVFRVGASVGNMGPVADFVRRMKTFSQFSQVEVVGLEEVYKGGVPMTAGEVVSRTVVKGGVQ